MYNDALNIPVASEAILGYANDIAVVQNISRMCYKEVVERYRSCLRGGQNRDGTYHEAARKATTARNRMGKHIIT